MKDLSTALVLDVGGKLAENLTVSQVELEDYFRNVSWPMIVTLLTATEPAMRKTDNPYFGRVQKFSRINGIVGFIYANAVNNQRQREAAPETVEEAQAVPEFVAAPRKWGQRIQGTALVEHKGNVYVEVKVERSLDHFYTVDGKLADAKQFEEIESFIPERKASATQQVEREVVLRDYRLENIKAVRVAGKQFTVKGV